MPNIQSIKHTIRNHINTFIFPKHFIGKNKKEEDVKKEFTIEYHGHKYTFNRLEYDEDKLVLYSYDKSNSDCVVLSIDTTNKIIHLTSFGNNTGCYKQETNIGSNLLRITLKMVSKYKDKLGLNKIILNDNSTYHCKTGENIDFDMMNILLYGKTWYEKYDFKPYNKNYKSSDSKCNISKQNMEIMNNIKVSDINMEYYLKKINKKFSNEFTLEIINELLNNNKDKLIKDFLLELFEKESFDLTCKYLNVIYDKLFKELKLQVPSHTYGKKI